VKYYKGLGTSTSKEAKEYFSDMDRHRIPFKYMGPEDDDAILLVSWRGNLIGNSISLLLLLRLVVVEACRLNTAQHPAVTIENRRVVPLLPFPFLTLP